MSTKPIIAIDIDDVLADHARQFVEFSNKRWDTNLTVEDYDEHWAAMWQIDNEETERRAAEFHSSKTITQYNSDESAREVLRELSEKFSLIILTSRRLEIEKETRAWIENHYPNIFSDIYFSGIWETIDGEAHRRTKADLCVTLGVRYLIDDQIKHCLGAAERGIEGLLFGEYSWNKLSELPPRVTRVRDWHAVKEYFKGK